MPDKLPNQLDPAKLAAKSAELNGSIPLKQFKRLGESLNSVCGKVVVNLQFKQVAPGYNCVAGDLETEFELICQRCLAPMQLPVKADFSLAVVDSEFDLDDLPDEYDPVVTEGKSIIHSVDLLEDELLLLVPVVSRHADENDCDPDMVYKASPNSSMADEGEKPDNPFAVLKDLTKKH